MSQRGDEQGRTIAINFWFISTLISVLRHMTAPIIRDPDCKKPDSKDPDISTESSLTISAIVVSILIHPVSCF